MLFRSLHYYRSKETQIKIFENCFKKMLKIDQILTKLIAMITVLISPRGPVAEMAGVQARPGSVRGRAEQR